MATPEPGIVRPWYNSSSKNDGSCVDTQFLADGSVQVRHSKDTGTVLTYTAAEWDAFIGGVKAGNHDPVV